MNLFYLIDSICKNTSSRNYIYYFEKDICNVFVHFYCTINSCSIKEKLRSSLKVLRKSWIKIFSEETLDNMARIILQKEKEDIDSNFTKEQIQKLKEFYIAKNIGLNKIFKKIF